MWREAVGGREARHQGAPGAYLASGGRGARHQGAGKLGIRGWCLLSIRGQGGQSPGGREARHQGVVLAVHQGAGRLGLRGQGG